MRKMEQLGGLYAMKWLVFVFVVLVLFGCNIVNNAGNLGVNQTESQTNKSVENESDSVSVADVVVEVVHNTSDKYYQKALDKMGEIEVLLSGLNLSGEYEEQRESILKKLNDSKLDFDALKYKTSYFNAVDTLGLLEDIKEVVDEKERARVEEEERERKEAEKFSRYDNLLRIEYEIDDDANIYVRTVDSGEKTIELFSIHGINKFALVKEMMNRTKFTEEEIKEKLKYKVVPRSEEEEAAFLEIDIKDFNGYTRCNAFFGVFSENDTVDAVLKTDFDGCRSFFNMVEDEFSNSEIDEVGGYSGCEDMYESYDERQLFSDINVADVKLCEDFFEGLKDRY